jgi:hypothetical protein
MPFDMNQWVTGLLQHGMTVAKEFACTIKPWHINQTALSS